VKQPSAGFTLLEVVVALTLLAFVLVGLAQLNFVLARRFYALSGAPARGGVIAQQVNQFEAMAFDSLPGKAGTVTVNKPPLPYTRTVIVTNSSAKLRIVTIIVTPLNPIFKPDTLVVEREKPAKNPLNQ
jgi:prepilin-type N-terminal cleavage/methylation domain-containing protein